MKTKIILILTLFFLLVGGCTLIEIIDAPERQQQMQLDSLVATSTDTTHIDTTKHPIGFDVSVEDWKEVIINK